MKGLTTSIWPMSSGRWLLILSIIGLLAFFMTRQTKIFESSMRAPLKAGEKPFDFAPDQVTKLTIASLRPPDGEPWTVSIERSEDLKWRMTSEPNGLALLDRLADGTFIMHLLDTLTTLQVMETHVTATEPTLGLSPSKVSLRWISEGESYEILIGEEPTQSGGMFAKIGRPGENAASAPVIILKGAALAMAMRLESFDWIRHRRLFPLELDDIQSVEVSRNDGSMFFAQRLSGGWGNRDHQPYSEKITEWLTALIHLRIEQFIDVPAEADDPDASPGGERVKIRILNLENRETVLRAFWKTNQDNPLATVSTRAGGRFRLFTGARSILTFAQQF